MSFWKSITEFCATNPIVLAVLAVLAVAAAICEGSSKVQTPIKKLVRRIKRKKLIKLEMEKKREEREEREEKNIQDLIHLYQDQTKKIDGICATINKVQDDVVTLHQQQIEQQRTMETDEIDRIRYEVLEFANSCRHEQRTRNEFEHIMALSEKYENLLQKTGATNGVFTEEYQFILELYRQHLRDDSFLS